MVLELSILNDIAKQDNGLLFILLLGFVVGALVIWLFRGLQI